MPGSLNLLLLHTVLDRLGKCVDETKFGNGLQNLGIDELLQLLLLGDQQMVLVGGGLGGHLLVGQF